MSPSTAPRQGRTRTQLNLLERFAAEDELQNDSEALTSVANEGPNPLMEVLLTLMDLDLTGSIVLEDTVMKRHGGYCDVFQGRMANGALVAVKRLRVYLQDDPKFTKRLAREVQIWSMVSHTNILPLMGYALEGDRYPALVTEWMENGTIAEYVRKNYHVDVLSLVRGIVAGLRYLHSNDIVHADLKAANILMSASGIPLITDFGISMLLGTSVSQGSTSSGLKGTARWMAPEVLRVELRAELGVNERTTPIQELHRLQLADVWAFGMTVYEILTRGLPYADHRNDAQVICAIIQGELPSCLQYWERWPNEYKALWSYICCPCWEALDIRPSITNIANNLFNVISNDLQPPPVPPFPTTSRNQMPPLPESNGLSRKKSATTSIASTKVGSESPTPKTKFSLSSSSKSYGRPPKQEDIYTPHHFLAEKCPELLHFDLQLPVTSIRKTLPQPAPLGLSDYREPASQPPCTEIVIEIEEHGILIHVEPSRTDFVTVQDVLRAIYGKLHQQPSPANWAKAGKRSADIISNFHKRHDRVSELALGQSDHSTYMPVLCDWLGSPVYFAGLTFKSTERKGLKEEAQWILDISHNRISWL